MKNFQSDKNFTSYSDKYFEIKNILMNNYNLQKVIIKFMLKKIKEDFNNLFLKNSTKKSP